MQDTYRRRRLVALGAAAAAIVLAVVAVYALTRGGGADGTSAKDAKPAPLAQLPRGGRVILPKFRVVAFYGAPQDPQLGTLGIGTPHAAGVRLRTLARAYRRLGRPVLPAMELLASVADAAPGPDGKYRTQQPDAVIARYLKAARQAKALLILDIQPGYADFLTESRHLRKWLEKPDVSLALDPEWHLQPPVIPGQQIGSVDAAEINAVSFWLADIVKKRRLPQKLLLIHRFTQGMIQRQEALKRRPGLALTINVDGFGARPNKIAKYHEFAGTPDRFFDGFKLFFQEDTNTMKPRDVAKLRPVPDLVVYE